MRATIDWSHDLLSPAERRLFARLAVFTGCWELAAAEAVCAGEGNERIDVLGGLAALVDQGLVYRAHVDGQIRFRMPATIREYALQQLESTGNAGLLRRRHARYYADLARAALGGGEASPVLTELAREQPNLRAALAAMLDDGQADLAARTAMALRRLEATTR